MIPVEKLTVRDAERAIGERSVRWHGRCYEIASALVICKAVKGKAVYGHWVGPIAATGYWKDRRGMPFVHHGWVKLPDGRVLDPTRWSFEDVKPYLYLGPPDHYDEGGNQIRAAMMANRPPPPFRTGGKDIYERRWRSVMELELKTEVIDFLMEKLGQPKGITREMMFWVANLPPDWLEPYTKEIYKELVRQDQGPWIPTDNRRMVLGYHDDRN